jgi:hypothetical protein
VLWTNANVYSFDTELSVTPCTFTSIGVVLANYKVLIAMIDTTVFVTELGHMAVGAVLIGRDRSTWLYMVSDDCI